jgi:hypothetical protein
MYTHATKHNKGNRHTNTKHKKNCRLVKNNNTKYMIMKIFYPVVVGAVDNRIIPITNIAKDPPFETLMMNLLHPSIDMATLVRTFWRGVSVTALSCGVASATLIPFCELYTSVETQLGGTLSPLTILPTLSPYSTKWEN